MLDVTGLLDLIERPWRLIEHSLADPSPHDERRHAGGRGSLPHRSHQLGLAHFMNASRNKLDTALTAARRNDLEHGTNAAYVHGCVCSECREQQRIRMSRNRR